MRIIKAWTRLLAIEIKSRETVAIVGKNGTGKTTLVRLLLGLYIPTEGRVIMNCIETRKSNSKSMFMGLSWVFLQNYQRYQMTLKKTYK